ncbi:MAG TPA: phosphate ABC transporter permease PstA [Gemmataceae bacterium]|nr:phosphate ABC transporter permease PstA [Gemmataceae bacterium]
MSIISAEQRDAQPLDLPHLEKSLKHTRTLNSAVMSAVIGGMSLLAMVPLASVLWMLLKQGSERLGPALFTELPPAAGMGGGGVGNALLGTLVVVALAALISVPVGILAAVFLAEIDPESKTAAAVRFCARLLTGLPSILAGVFAYGVVVLTTGTFSAPAGGVALSLLMIPVVLLTAEEAIRMVPARMREAAVGMGCTRTQMVLRVTLPTALPGILTGVMLAVARAAGETAPLLFTALFSDYWLTANVMEPTPTLAVLIFDFSGSPFPNQIQIAWAASLVLVFLVLLLNVGAQVLTRRYLHK